MIEIWTPVICLILRRLFWGLCALKHEQHFITPDFNRTPEMPRIYLLFPSLVKYGLVQQVRETYLWMWPTVNVKCWVFIARAFKMAFQFLISGCFLYYWLPGTDMKENLPTSQGALESHYQSQCVRNERLKKRWLKPQQLPSQMNFRRKSSLV